MFLLGLIYLVEKISLYVNWNKGVWIWGNSRKNENGGVGLFDL